MSGTEGAYNLTKEDVRKAEAREARAHGGNIPADSYAAGLQSIVDSADRDKVQVIEERKANLPLPDDPPQAPDFNSADARTVNVGSGGTSDSFTYGQDSLREPAAGDSAFRTDGNALKTNTVGQGVGRQGAEGLSGLPNDAVAQGSKGKPGLADTTNADYGYPQKSDPADTSKLP